MRIIVSLTLILLNLFGSLAYAAFPNGVVVTENKLASDVGANILASGGNAIDAAVAVGYALAVVNPCCGNIGGGGFMTIHLANGENIFINFREKAPSHATTKLYLTAAKKVDEDKTTKGFLAVAVPGTVLGLDTALERYGTMNRKQVMEPAIKLAEEGFPLTPYAIDLLNKYTNDFLKEPNVARIFLNMDEPYKPGEIFVQNDLAKTLRKISEKGPGVFYHGEIAKTLVQESNKNGGVLSKDDFADYHIEIIPPLVCHYRNLEIITANLPSSGGVTLCEMLGILENFPLAQRGPQSLQNLHDIIMAMGFSFNDRNTKLGDSQFTNNPIDELISKNYTTNIAKEIQNYSSIKKIPATSHKELTDTTHYSIIDKAGNAVSVTYTINGFFGARVIAGNTGFLLNNEIDDFTIQSGTSNKFGLMQQENNLLEPNKRPLSSMTPTIILKDGKVWMILGSPGGPRIITSVLLTLLNVIDYKMPLQKAIDEPRYHFQSQPNMVDVEKKLSKRTMSLIKKLGYPIYIDDHWGAVEGIMIQNNIPYGANDNRRPDGGAVSV